jgi:hypothetical protein
VLPANDLSEAFISRIGLLYFLPPVLFFLVLCDLLALAGLLGLLLLPPVRTGMPTGRRESRGMKIVDAPARGVSGRRELSAVVPVTCRLDRPGEHRSRE